PGRKRLSAYTPPMPSAITRPSASATRSAVPESTSASRRNGIGSFAGPAPWAAVNPIGTSTLPAMRSTATALRARLAREDFGDLHAKAVPRCDQRAARHHLAVEQHVDRFARAAVEREHRVLPQLDQLLHRELAAADAGREAHLHAADQVEVRLEHFPPLSGLAELGQADLVHCLDAFCRHGSSFRSSCVTAPRPAPLFRRPPSRGAPAPPARRPARARAAPPPLPPAPSPPPPPAPPPPPPP